MDRIEWRSRRDAGIPPAFSSGFHESAEDRAAFLEGARLMGYLVDGETLHPQQLAVADTISAPRRTHVVEIPRRATKTTSIFLTLLGRCALRPRYLVTYTAQSGVAGSRQFVSWAQQLDAVNPPDDLDLPPWLRGRPRKSAAATRQIALFGEELGEPEVRPTSGRGFKTLKGAGHQQIRFDNLSTFTHIGPNPANFRGQASDVSWLDEAQEIDVEDGPDLLAAIRPLQDTRPGASIILSGTAGEIRAGIFWDHLERGRAGDPDVGILDYAAPPDTSWAAIEDVDEAMRILRTVHPGIGTLTTEEIMRAQWRDLPRPQWAREYLSLWPETFTTRVIPAPLWEAAHYAGTRPARPSRVAFGVAVKPGGSVAAIAAAWRDETGTAFVEVVRHESGTKWLPSELQRLTNSPDYRGAVVGYDARGEGAATRTETDRLRPPARMNEHRWNDITAGSIQLMRDLERGTLRHFGQLSLDLAVSVASRRDSGDVGAWTWAPMQPAADIVCLDAATRALRQYDSAPVPGSGIKILRPTNV